MAPFWRVGEAGGVEIGLVVVRANGVGRGVVRGIDIARRATASYFKQDIRAGRDLGDAELLAECRVLGIRVRNLPGQPRVDTLRAGDVARDIRVDGRAVV